MNTVYYYTIIPRTYIPRFPVAKHHINNIKIPHTHTNTFILRWSSVYPGHSNVIPCMILINSIQSTYCSIILFIGGDTILFSQKSCQKYHKKEQIWFDSIWFALVTWYKPSYIFGSASCLLKVCVCVCFICKSTIYDLQISTTIDDA